MRSYCFSINLTCKLSLAATNPTNPQPNNNSHQHSDPTFTKPTLSPSPQPIETPTTSVSNLYNAELTYVYVGPTNSTGEGHDHFGFNVTTYPSTYYPVTMIFKLTYLGNPENEPYDAKFEGFQVKFFADTDATASYIDYFGTNFNPSYSNLPNPFPGTLSDPRHITVNFRFNLTANESFLNQVSDAGSYGSSPGSLGLWSKGTPNTITVTVQRAGWVTANGELTSTIPNPTNDVVLQQVQLEKSGNGFLYGSP